MSSKKNFNHGVESQYLFFSKHLLTIIFLLISIIVFAQQKLPAPSAREIVISGIVSDDKGKVLSGVTVALKGKQNGTTTDPNGYYKISIHDNKPILVFSSVGFFTQEVSINNQITVNVVLVADTKLLTNVVVTGYSKQSKRDITGAVAVVDVEELKAVPNANFEQQLQGRVAGVTVTTDGAPGGETIVRIRGIGSVTGSSDPLFIIDGVPVEGGLRQLNPADIESMQILKDAASASIYGARASNGVVIVTTKKGKGKTMVSFDSYLSSQNPQYDRFPKFVTPLEQAQLQWDAYLNAGIGAPNSPVFGNGPAPAYIADYLINPTGNPTFVKEGDPLADPANYSYDPSDPKWQDTKYIIVKLNKQGTDWYRETFKPALMQNYNFTVSGSTDKNRFAISGGYLNQQGIMINSYFKRYSVRANSEFNIGNRFRIGENMQISFNNGNLPSRNAGIFSTVGRIFYTNTIEPVYDIGGHYTGTPNNYYWYHNPVAEQDYAKDNKNNESRILGNVYLEADILRGLTAKTSFGLDYFNQMSSIFSPKVIQELESSGDASLSVSHSNATNWVWTNTLNYDKVLNGLHRLSLIVGSEAVSNMARYDGISGYGFASNDISYRYLSAALHFNPAYGGGTDSRLFSFFGKADYIYNDKYLFTATIRRDASSRFAPAYRWGTFPAFSIGWRLSKEKFFQSVKFINDLKLRGSWGQTGNQNIGEYNQYSTYSGNPGTTAYDINGTGNSIISGYARALVGNPLAQWEAQTMTNLGLDVAFLKNQLSLTVDLFDRKSTKLLMYVPHPSVDGQASFPAENVGSVENKGIELMLDYNNHAFNRKFNYDVTVNFSTYTNNVTALYGGKDSYIGGVGNGYQGPTSGVPTRTAVGHPISSFYGMIIDGIFQTQSEADKSPVQFGNADLYNKPGRWKFKDVNGDGVIDPTEDRTFIGNPNPKFTYGINLNASYKGIDMSLFFQGVYGNQIFNSMKYWTDFVPSDISYAASVTAKNYWTPNNPHAKLPQINANAENGYETGNSTYYVESGSYFRLKNLQIGYSFPSVLLSRYSISKLRLFISATNLFTITKYTGIDPEVTVAQGSLLSAGVDQGIYPFSRSYSFGLQLGF